MNKSEFIDLVKTNGNYSNREDAESAVNNVLESLRDGLKQDEKIQLTGFGVFTVKAREEREGRNPKTGAPITIPAKKNVTFKAGKLLKEELN